MWLFFIRIINGTSHFLSNDKAVDSSNECIDPADSGCNSTLSPKFLGSVIQDDLPAECMHSVYHDHDYFDLAPAVLNRFCGVYPCKNIMHKMLRHDETILKDYFSNCSVLSLHRLIENKLTNNNFQTKMIYNSQIKKHLIYYLALAKELPVNLSTQKNIIVYLSSLTKSKCNQIQFFSLYPHSDHLLSQSFIEILNNDKIVPEYLYCSPRTLGLFINFHNLFENDISSFNEHQCIKIQRKIDLAIHFALANKSRIDLLNARDDLNNIQTVYEKDCSINCRYNSFFYNSNYFILSESLFSNLIMDTNMSDNHLSLFKTLARYCPLDDYNKSINMLLVCRQIHYIFNLSFMFLDEENIQTYFCYNKSSLTTLSNWTFLRLCLTTQQCRHDFLNSIPFLNFFYKIVLPKIIQVLEHIVCNEKHKFMLKLLCTFIPEGYPAFLCISFEEVSKHTYDEDLLFLYNLGQTKSTLDVTCHVNLYINVIFEVLIGYSRTTII